jgi:hypothetical protein
MRGVAFASDRAAACKLIRRLGRLSPQQLSSRRQFYWRLHQWGSGDQDWTEVLSNDQLISELSEKARTPSSSMVATPETKSARTGPKSKRVWSIV